MLFLAALLLQDADIPSMEESGARYFGCLQSAVVDLDDRRESINAIISAATARCKHEHDILVISTFDWQMGKTKDAERSGEVTKRVLDGIMERWRPRLSLAILENRKKK